MNKIKKIKFALLTVLVALFTGMFTSCDKMEDEPIAHEEDKEILNQDGGISNLRASNTVYYSTPTVGGTVPNSTINIKGKGTATYHGGILSAKVLSQNGNKFTIRIFKQDGGAFTGGGLAIIISGAPDGGDFSAHKRYYPGDTHVDIEITATFDQGAVHFYPSTIALPSRYRYYAEPILVYTNPLYKIKNKYTHGEVLGTINGVAVKANGQNNQSSGKNQCTTFCINYYNRVYGKNYIHYLDAHKWYNDTKNFPDLDRYRNGGSVAPRPGDILCMSGGNNGLGHVAIIMEVTGSYIKIAQQNSGIPGDEWQHAIGGELSRRGNTIIPPSKNGEPSKYTIDGWMRVKVK